MRNSHGCSRSAAETLEEHLRGQVATELVVIATGLVAITNSGAAVTAFTDSSMTMIVLIEQLLPNLQNQEKSEYLNLSLTRNNDNMII